MTYPSASFIYYQDAASIEALRNSQIMTYVRDLLLLRALRIRTLEESLIRFGHATRWHEENAPSHDAMCAVALALDRVLAKGKDQAQRGVKIDPLIEEIGSALKSSLILEMTQRADRPEGEGAAA